VKLIPDSFNDDEPHLPDSPRANLPWHIRLLKRSLSHLLSASGLTIGVGIILTLLLTGIISLGYLDVVRDVDKNGISLKDLYADYRLEVVDEQATQRKIDRTLTPIYQEATPHNQDILESETQTKIRTMKLDMEQSGALPKKGGGFSLRNLFSSRKQKKPVPFPLKEKKEELFQ